MHHGTIVFIELSVRDLKRSADFYAGLFGWSFEEDPVNSKRWLFTPPGLGAMGAISTEHAAGPGGARIAVAVERLSETADRAIALGGGPGEVVRTDIGNHLALVDPDGNHLWAFESKLARTVRPIAPS